MRANREFFSLLVLTSLAWAAQAQSPAPNAAAGVVQPPPTQQQAVQPATQQPIGATPAATAASAPALARPSDTIGEAADRQRMQRMLASQAKPGGSSVPAIQQAGTPGPVVGAITVERAPGGASTASKPLQPEMALVEILRGPKATLVAIEVSGVERRVAEGDDLGNGWRVKKVGRFTVELEEYAGDVTSTNAPAAPKGKAKPAAQKKVLKTQTLALKAAPVVAGDVQRNPNAIR